MGKKRVSNKAKVIHGPSKDELRRFRAEELVRDEMTKSTRFKRAVQSVIKDMKKVEKKAASVLSGKGAKKKP